MSINVEIWKPVKDYPNYQVSNHGRVRGPKVIRKPGLSSWGYHHVNISNENGASTKKIHRLVAEAFISNPHNKPCVNHLNGIKTDNRVENLEWVTNQENARHAHDTGLKDTKKMMAARTASQLAKTHCNRGHLLDGIRSAGRFCKTCQRASKRRYIQRKKDERLRR